MMSKTVYILGPMRGIPLYNFPAFDAMRDAVNAMPGLLAVSPADIDRASGYDPSAELPDHDWREIPTELMLGDIVRRDVEAAMGCAAYVCLPGWEASTGARAEKALLEWTGAEDLTPQFVAPQFVAPVTVCVEAERLTHGDRHAAYGHPLDNFQITVDLINARFRNKISKPFVPEDFAEIMILAKIARQANAHKRDNPVDIAGYANTLQMVKDERARRMGSQKLEMGMPTNHTKGNE